MNASTIVNKGLKAEKSNIASEIITWMNSNAKRHRTLVDLSRFLYFASKLARLPVTRLGGAGAMTDGWRGEEYTHMMVIEASTSMLALMSIQQPNCEASEKSSSRRQKMKKYHLSSSSPRLRNCSSSHGYIIAVNCRTHYHFFHITNSSTGTTCS